MNALTEPSALELADFGIRARVVVPGARDQLRHKRAGANRGERRFPDAYAGFVQQTMAAMQQNAASGQVTTAHDVAEAVFRAATDPDCPMILPAGADAIAWSEGR